MPARLTWPRLTALAIALATGALWTAPARLEAQAIRLVQGEGPRRPPPQGIAPRQGGPPGARDPNEFIERLMEMEPDRRSQFLESNQRFQRLPQAERERIERRLEQFDKMPAEKRELLISRFQLFSRLRPEQQRLARSLYDDWSKLRRDRRNRISAAVRRLRRAQPETRERLMSSARFNAMFDKDEKKMIEDILDLQPPPPLQPPQ